MEVVGRDADGRNIYKELGQAVKGSVSDTNEGWRQTGTGGVESRTKAMEGALTATANAFDVYDRMEALAKSAPAGLAWTGTLSSKADSVIAGVKNLTEALVSADNLKVDANMDYTKYDFSKLEKVAAASDKIKSLAFQLAYSQAAAGGDSSRSISDQDIQNQLNIIGGNITNPKSFLELAKQNKELLVSKLDNMAKYTRIDGKSIYGNYSKDIEGLKSRIGMQSGMPKGTVTMYRGDRKYNIPEDEVDAFTAAGGSRNKP
jgi:hypothetical protein